MASLFDNLNSSDSEDDADYVPENESSDDEEPEPKPAICSSDDESETKKEKKDSNEGDKMDKDEKERANSIYESFLKEVESEMISKEKEESDLGLSSSASSSVVSTSATIVSSDVNSEKNLSAETSPEKPAEVVEFAGEKIAVAKDGTILSTESSDSSAVAKNTPTTAPLKRKGGLQSVLGIIQNKKAKVSTLKKSALDWNTFKKQEGIAEELERFNKGKGGYTERQRFLQRSDVKSFEIEREMRLSRFKKS